MVDVAVARGVASALVGLTRHIVTALPDEEIKAVDFGVVVEIGIGAADD